MPSLINGRVLLGAAVVGLVAVAGTMIVAHQDKAPPVARKGAAVQVAAAAPATPVPAASASPAVDEGFTIKRILPIEGAIKYGEWHWDDKDVPDGPIVVTVDLDARVLSIFKGGYEIGASAVLLGTQDKPTPLGVFPIMQKKAQHTSNLYDAEMPYMQRLTNDGVALHASNVRWGYASHGCISMPLEFAKKVFETTKVGDKVYITRGKQVGMGDSLTS
ncbi:L,D-transpeptidase family protein [Novosphingobium sp. PS1R-30]|uniref:L,D-transpeptidase family protein n=1 Tax=Novosphingobium anseongense TaxID=3133436 RepID=A0ABU8RYS0_9SPHN